MYNVHITEAYLGVAHSEPTHLQRSANSVCVKIVLNRPYKEFYVLVCDHYSSISIFPLYLSFAAQDTITNTTN